MTQWLNNNNLTHSNFLPLNLIPLSSPPSNISLVMTSLFSISLVWLYLFLSWYIRLLVLFFRFHIRWQHNYFILFCFFLINGKKEAQIYNLLSWRQNAKQSRKCLKKNLEGGFFSFWVKWDRTTNCVAAVTKMMGEKLKLMFGLTLAG